jgi:hypothetical protein
MAVHDDVLHDTEGLAEHFRHDRGSLQVEIDPDRS